MKKLSLLLCFVFFISLVSSAEYTKKEFDDHYEYYVTNCNPLQLENELRANPILFKQIMSPYVTTKNNCMLYVNKPILTLSVSTVEGAISKHIANRDVETMEARREVLLADMERIYYNYTVMTALQQRDAIREMFELLMIETKLRSVSR